MKPTDDFCIVAAKYGLLASKRLDYKEEVKNYISVFIRFLQTNGLTVRTILRDEEEVTTDTVLYKSDLTDLGFLLVKEAYNRWLKGIDRGKPIEDVSILAKALRKLREQESQDP